MSVTWDDDSLSAYVEASGTFTFNDSDVQWAYVDWDDGEDNSLDKAINQWKKLDTDSNSITLTHTYTKTGSFYPVVRTVNSAGFLSKYFYDSEKADSSTIPEPSEAVQNIDLITITDGEPLPILKVENKIVKSGIDNSIFEQGPKEVFIYVPPLLASGNAALDKSCTLKVKYIDADLIFSGGPATSGNYDLGYERVVRETERSFSLMSGSHSISLLGSLSGIATGVKKSLGLLDVRLTTPRIDTSIDSVRNDFNKLKIFLIAQANNGKWHPITYVSNGDPIKKAGDREVLLDFSQTRTKASNTSISDYWFDNGKVFWSPVNQWEQFNAGLQFDNDTRTTSSFLNTAYTYYTRPRGLLGSSSIGGSSSVGFVASGQNFYYTAGTTEAFIRDQFPLNEYNQFYDQYHLARITASSSGGKNSTLDPLGFAYRITPALATAAAADLFLDTNATTDNEKTYTFKNGYTQGIDTNNWNGVQFLNNDAVQRPMSEYFIFTNDVKFNKIFFNNTPYAKEFMSNLTTTTTGNTVEGLYYLRTGTRTPPADAGVASTSPKFTEFVEWVPLNFKDTTKISKEIRDSTNGKYVTYEETMTKPGFLEFEMPSDWAKISASDLCGGLWDNSTNNPTTANDYSIAITATYSGTKAIEDGWPVQYILETYSLGGGNTFTDEDMGNFNYVFQYTDGDAGTPTAGGVFWVVSCSAEITPQKLYLASSSTEQITSISLGEDINGIVRRVNAYDFFEGAPKVRSNWNMPKGGLVPYPYTFMWSTSAALSEIDTNLTNQYPLKMVLAGQVLSEGLPDNPHFVSGGRVTGMEMWNVLPFNNSFSETIIQQDNTAYDLSYLAITSDVGVSYAGTFYTAISKNGRVFIKRTGTKISNITFAGNALGDDASFSFNEDYTSYGTLRLLRRMEAESVRVMWDEQQKDGTFVRFFGYVQSVSETHQVGGRRASRPFSFAMAIEEICLLDTNGDLMSDVEPLGGSPNARRYQ